MFMVKSTLNMPIQLNLQMMMTTTHLSRFLGICVITFLKDSPIKNENEKNQWFE